MVKMFFKRYCRLIAKIRMRGNILATQNQQAIINDVIDVEMGVYLYKN